MVVLVSWSLSTQRLSIRTLKFCRLGCSTCRFVRRTPMLFRLCPNDLGDKIRYTISNKTLPFSLSYFQHCDLVPYTECQLKTRLIPKLKAVPVCTEVPNENCLIHLNARERVVKKPHVSIWCRPVRPTAPGGLPIPPGT